MALFIASLNSGSNGNCYYVGNETEAVLIDLGISCREAEKRLKRLNLAISKIKGIFISHEHSDHIKGLRVFCKKHKVPVFINSKTLHGCGFILSPTSIHPLDYTQSIEIGTLKVTAFSKYHDAADPCSFLVESNGICIGVFTDIGLACANTIHHFKQCHAAFLESNYDDNMLDQGNYPPHLKARIKDGKGHLSNRQALQLFLDHKPTWMTHLILSHLSENNNHPAIVEKLFKENANGVEIIIASRYAETNVIKINTAEAGNNTRISALKQLELF